MIKNLIKRIVYKEKYDSDSYIKWMKSQGAIIGERTVIFSPTKTLIDMTRPWLIEIGSDVQITEGVKILTHGYDWSVLKGKYGTVLGSAGTVKIGSNVFIGMNTIILKGVRIGNNVIIGAGSLINKDIPDNCVVAGNPAKVIMSIDNYFNKRKNSQLDEAKQLVLKYREVYNRDPGEEELSEFFYLFSNGNKKLPLCWERMMKLVGNEDYSYSILKKNLNLFDGIDDFLKSVK
ncbi:acyltransferase [Clostridium perfringens]